jgi:hypothetical protein
MDKLDELRQAAGVKARGRYCVADVARILGLGFEEARELVRSGQIKGSLASRRGSVLDGDLRAYAEKGGAPAPKRKPEPLPPPALEPEPEPSEPDAFETTGEPVSER